MAYEWTPLAGTVIISGTEGRSGFDVTIRASQLPHEATDPPTPNPNPVPAKMSVTLPNGIPNDAINITTTSNSVRLQSDLILGFFPIEIDYLQGRLNDTRETANSWAALPEDAQEIVKVKPDKNSPKTYTVSITARQSNNTKPQTVSYLMIIANNFDAIKERLRIELAKRED
ncbi:MAG: hypothetical protein CMF22_11345 [Idiomarinaceae bacterium]|nr:hypothetical protein [Idiomarinaceae bacterium]|tara:strand:- start:112943 stop:113458 length:516 start_codon:yes stop_codon:yes gene_type:complete